MFQYMGRPWNSPVLLAGAALLLTMGGCSQEPGSSSVEGNADAELETLPQVVVTTSVLCDLTEQIAQDTIALTCLLDPGQDPHTYQSKPSDRQAIDEADLVLYDGYDLVPSMVGLIEASSTTAPKIAVYEAAVPEPLMGNPHSHDHDADESAEAAHGHDHDEADHVEVVEHTEGEEGDESSLAADPHVWHSAANNGAIAQVVAENLALINPAQAEVYESKSAELSELFAELDEWIEAQVATVPAENRKLVTTHDSFRYFADAYGFEVKGALGGISTEGQPSAKTLTDLVDVVKQAQVPAIFAESTTNPELINAIANDAAVQIAPQALFVEGPGTDDSEAPTVQAMLVFNTCAIVDALEGTCNQAAAPL